MTKRAANFDLGKKIGSVNSSRMPTLDREGAELSRTINEVRFFPAAMYK